MPEGPQVAGRESFRLLYPPHKPARGAALPDSSFFHTLQIDQMVSVRRESWRGLPDLRLEQFYTTDTDVLAWRLDVVADLVASQDLRDLIRDALPMLRDAAEMRKVLNSSSSSVESSLASVRYLEIYLELVELFHSRLASAPIRSAGFSALRQEVEKRRTSDSYQALTRQLEQTEYQIGHIKSIALGINLDGTLRVTDVGLLALNTDKYRQGSVLDKLLGRDKKDPMVCISGFANLAKTAREEEKHALDQAVCRALDTAFARTIRSWEPVIDQYFRDETAFFIGLLDDFRFLSAAVSFLLELKSQGCALCRPTIRPMEEKALHLKDVYNPMLVLRSEDKGTVVANDFGYDAKGRFYLVTGPNHGGKSIFCYSVGMAQALFQLGLLVPAKEAVMSPVRCIFTHFPTSDEDNYGKGRLESECARMSQILHLLTGEDLLLMDESFSSTSLLEGGYIAGEVLSAIAVMGCGGVYVTHIHELTQEVDRFNATPGRTGCIDNLVAQMENIADGTRSYRVIRATPDGLSYAKDIARKYGLSCEEILASRQG
ncbi:hypothetical protein [Faecalibacterium sp. An122]|uniref:MutS-related protein n=1 Tax=Faecalibacterium sp. An122 TaxID=1965551 RepID=UPI000B5766E3|nr:hypothetical protein [Faecalibacterium sp. An122]OUQ39437.1 hypothetical protein B5E67_02720 [Faecalibacterium sp. An122]